MVRVRILLSLVLCALMTSPTLMAQLDRATLAGSVTDPSGAALVGAKVTIVQQDTGLKREVVVSGNGFYTMPQLPVGMYAVTVEAAGFQSKRYDKVELQVGQTRTLDVRLEVAALATQIEVQDTVPPLDRSSAEIGSVIQSSQIGSLPVNGRHWASLMLLAPGAINTGAGTQDSTRFVGRANDDNNWTFDGVDNTAIKDPTYGANVRLVVSMDSIAEFKVSSSMYSAESGGGAGGQVHLVSKSGSNDFHGGAFEYLRNSALDARTVFDGPTLPPFKLNQFGGNIGGPIVKSKLFFFANYEGLRQRQGSTYTAQVPSDRLRAEVLAKSPPLKQVIDAYPRGTKPTKDVYVDDYVTDFAKTSDEDSVAWRVDYNISDRTTIFFRHSIDHGINQTPAGVKAEYHTEDRNQPQNYVLQVQRTFSPTMVNEVRLGVNRLPAIIDEIGPYPTTFSIPGLTTIMDTRINKEIGTTYSVIDNFSLFRGRHNLKIGGEFRVIHMNNEVGPVDSASFSSMSNFINNKVDGMGVSPGVPMLGGRRNFYFLYAQDDLKLRPNLTLNLGVRYEYYSVLGEQYDRMAPFDEVNGVFLPASAGAYEPDYNNIAPRFSFAWSPSVFKDKMVIRGGYGMFYGPGQNDDVFGPIESIEESYALTSSEAPGLSWPIDPWLDDMKSLGRTPRHLKRDRVDEYSQQWGLSIQQQLPAQFVTQIGFSGNNAHHILSRSYINLIDPATGKRPWAGFSRIDSRRDDANGTFSGLQASLKRRLGGGTQGSFEYMWSHALNDGAIGGGESTAPQNVNNRYAEKSNSNYDIRHTLAANFSWELPFGPGRRFLTSGGFSGAVLGGWELSGIVAARTGRALNISVTRSSSAMPDGNSSNQRPNLVPGVPIYPETQTLSNWLNIAAFSVPASKTWGNLGKNIARGPGVHQWDIALQKTTKINEAHRIAFRAEFFNIFNRPHFANPATNISAPSSFGRITAPMNREIGTGTARQIQFMLRYIF